MLDSTTERAEQLNNLKLLLQRSFDNDIQSSTFCKLFVLAIAHLFREEERAQLEESMKLLIKLLNSQSQAEALQIMENVGIRLSEW